MGEWERERPTVPPRGRACTKVRQLDLTPSLSTPREGTRAVLRTTEISGCLWNKELRGIVPIHISEALGFS